MEVFEQRKENTLILSLQGRLDSATSQKTQERITEIVSANKMNLLFDGMDLQYVSSAGIRVFLKIAFSFKKQGRKLGFYSLSPEISKVFRVVNLHSIIPVFSSQSEALKQLAQQEV